MENVSQRHKGPAERIAALGLTPDAFAGLARINVRTLYGKLSGAGAKHRRGWSDRDEAVLTLLEMLGPGRMDEAVAAVKAGIGALKPES